MIPRECKRLAEVDFPIAEVSKHAVNEKSIRHGHPNTLHLWWARRPLASCRAILMALLLPDPCDPLCPGDFKIKARKILPELCGVIKNTDDDLQRKLLIFIGNFADWNNASKLKYLEISRSLINAANTVEKPLVVDPFAGGGSIPLEALRIGCDVFASDLNPVSSLIMKVMLDDIPRIGTNLVDDLRFIGDAITNSAKEKLKFYYPLDHDGSQPIAYLWARTVRCESPNCGAEIPLMRSFWLSTKSQKKLALNYSITKSKAFSPIINFDIFEPIIDKEVHGPTVTRAKATCLSCGSVLHPNRVHTQLSSQSGGADTIFDSNGNRIGGALLLAVVFLNDSKSGRQYRLAEMKDYEYVFKAHQKVDEILSQWVDEGQNGFCPFPDEPTPKGGGSGAGRAFSVQNYGMMSYSDMFSRRQLLSLYILSNVINKYASSPGIKRILALVLSKLTDRSNSLVNWSLAVECPDHLFKGNSIPIGWDFCESNIIGPSSASIVQSFKNLTSNIQASIIPHAKPTTPSILDACNSPLPSKSVDVWFTDPPYYDSVPYSDLSDFFLVWQKRVLFDGKFNTDPFDKGNTLSNKSREIVQDDARRVDDGIKDKAFFEQKMYEAFKEGERVLKEEGIASVVFAHKTTEGWEALLSGMINAGFIITASWPIATERYSRMRARNSAALATSIHLVCRNRPDDAKIGDWADVMHELPLKVRKWIDRLESEGIRGADLVFSCIGPALEIYSRYIKVETAEGKEVSISEYLEKVWEVVGRIALEQVLGTAEAKADSGVAGALEEDARLTALFLWTMQSTGNGSEIKESNPDIDEEKDETDIKPGKTKGGYSLLYDVARRFAQPLGIDLEKWNNRIIEMDKGIVRLFSIYERETMLFGTNAITRADTTLELDQQLNIFPGLDETPLPKIKGKKVQMSGYGNENKSTIVTTLDRVHAAMLLQANGQTNALRALTTSESDKGQEFIRLANALSALYPKDSEEKRLIDAMLVGIKSI